MIKLRLIGSSADLQHLVYSNKKTGKRGSHIVAIDDDLFDVLEDVVRRRRRGEGGEEEDLAPRPVAPRIVSKIPPKDVQRMLRAGRTPEQVAKSAAVPLAWVEQFLVPVLYERQGMAREAQRAYLSKQRLGESGLPLGEAVDANLRARHVRLSDAEMADAWDALRTEGQPWTVTLTFRFRGRSQKATWKYDPARRSVTAANRLAADLGWVAPGKRSRTTERTSRFVNPAPRAKRETADAKPKRAPAKKRAAAKKKKAPAKKRVAAKKRAPAKKRVAAKKRTAARRPVAKKRAPAKKRTAARRPAKKRAAAKKRTAARRPASRTRTATRRAPAKKRATARRRARR